MMAKTVPVGLTLAAAMFFSASVAAAQPRAFAVRSAASHVTVVSDAPLETMRIVATQVSGELTFDPNDLSTVRGRIEVPVSSLRTGIDLRDHHVRTDTWLDEARYPTITFEILGVTGATRLEPNQLATVQVRGRFSVHGRTHEITVPAQVKLTPGGAEGDTLRFRARFPVKLADYGISIPAVVQLKVAAEMSVDANLVAVARPAS